MQDNLKMSVFDIGWGNKSWSEAVRFFLEELSEWLFLRDDELSGLGTDSPVARIYMPIAGMYGSGSDRN